MAKYNEKNLLLVGIKGEKGEQGFMNKNDVLNLIYPIGSIYMNVNDVDPSVIFENTTWEKLENRFLLGAGSDYNLGDTGGEATHTLTEEEMPRHKHETRDQDTDGIFGRGFGASRAGIKYTAYESNDNVGALLETEYKGNSRPHNNMPPYLVVNMWKRIA